MPFVTVCAKNARVADQSVQQFVLNRSITFSISSINLLPQAAVRAAPDGLAIDAFEFWVPERRPERQNLAFELSRNLHPFSTGKYLKMEFFSPPPQPNAWVAALQSTFLH